jgi:anthranilate synthase component 1
VEKKKLPFSKAPKDDRNLADIHLGLYDDVIVFDHVEKVLLFSCINNVNLF